MVALHWFHRLLLQIIVEPPVFSVYEFIDFVVVFSLGGSITSPDWLDATGWLGWPGEVIKIPKSINSLTLRKLSVLH